ncbi:MAG: hypothetical protein H6747_13350 [Deltaproteobacteria bacterium]|nr:hypothetical protein [Deltaproteobacteria bacterium]
MLLTALLTTLFALGAPARCAYAVARDPVAARALAARAYDLYQARSYEKAAQLYRAAADADPDDPAYGYNAARAAQLAGQLEAAEAGFVATLRHGGATATMRQQAQRHLDEVRAALSAVHAARKRPTAGTSPVGPAAGPTATDGSTRRTVGWVLLASGALLGIGSGIVFSGALGEQSSLDAALAVRDGNGKIVGIDPTTASQRQNDINADYALGWGLAGGAVAGVGIGVVLLALSPKTPATVTLWPGGRGLGLHVAF